MILRSCSLCADDDDDEDDDDDCAVVVAREDDRVPTGPVLPAPLLFKSSIPAVSSKLERDMGDDGIDGALY